MSNFDHSPWLESIRRKTLRSPVVFLQLGASNEPARRAFRSQAGQHISVMDYLSSEGVMEVGTLVVGEVEKLSGISSASNMGPLRARIGDEVENGSRVVLLSRAPRAAFPDVVGSSLLDDASFAQAPAIKAEAPAAWPTCREDGADPGDTLRKSLAELGPEVCSSLDRVIYESFMVGEEALMLFSARELEALDGAGLTSELDLVRSWNFRSHLTPLKQALDDVLANVTVAQDTLPQVSSGLWRIERLIRREVRRRAISEWGPKWRQQLLSESSSATVLDRAAEEAYPGALSVKQLRDPLEWLSLGELLQLKELPQIGDLGLNSAWWRNFSAQIIPIRNRLAHMRTLRPGDSAEVSKWCRALEIKLSTK